MWPCRHAIEDLSVEDDLMFHRRTVVSLEQVARRVALALLLSLEEERRARSFTQSMWPSKLACNEGGFLLLLNDQSLTVESLDAVYMELPCFLSNSKAFIPL